MTHLLLNLAASGTKVCGLFTPQSPFHDLYAALVCGVDLPGGRDRAVFVDTGLIHLLVVSGAHLMFLESRLKGLDHRPRLAVLALYCWLTGFGAPVLRALLRRLTQPVTTTAGWTRLQLEAAVTATLLVCHPAWLHSRSFLMSWMCALALAMPPNESNRLPVFTCAKVYLLLFPFCASSPLVIAWNVLLGPCVGSILFPISLTAFVLPPVTSLADVVWEGTIWLLANGPTEPPFGLTLTDAQLCWIPVLVHTILLGGEVRWRRAVAFS